MKLMIYQHDRPIEIDTDRVHVMCGADHFELREQQGHGRDGLLIRLEEHDGALAMDLAVFPNGANAVRLKGGLQ